MRWVAALAAVLSGAVVVRAAAAPPVEARASLDRTAMWIADRVTYTIEITCRDGANVLDEDLSRDKLKLDGLDLLGTETTTENAPGGLTVHRYRYVLTTYKADTPNLSIGPLTVRYYVKRPGERVQDAAPAGEVTIPAATVAFRSALPDTGDAIGLRSDRPATRRATVFAVARPVGLALILVSIVPVAIWGAAVIRASRQPRTKRSARQVRHDEQESLEMVRAIDLNSVEGRREAFTRMDALVRRHLKDVCGVPGASLTSAEVTDMMNDGHRVRVPAETVTSLLAACEVGRYAPADAVPSAEACRDALSQAETVLATH